MMSLALANAIQNLKPAQVDETVVPSYKHYNVKFVKGDLNARFKNEIPSRDVRAGAYTAHYHGEDAEDEIIVAQQLIKVLDAFKNQSADQASFEEHLKKKLFMPAERAEELAALSPHIHKAISDLPTKTVTKKWKGEEEEITIIDWSKASPDLLKAISIFTESTQNWASQPEHFVGTENITQRLMQNPKFTTWAAKEMVKPMGGYPLVGIFERELGYKNSGPLDEADKAQQAVMRIFLMPRDAIELTRMKNVHDQTKAPNPFPITLGKDGKPTTFGDVEPYAIDIQTAAVMIRAIADVESSLTRDEKEHLEALRLKWTQLSAREVIHIYKREQAKPENETKITLKNKIQEMIDNTEELKVAVESEMGITPEQSAAYDRRPYDPLGYHVDREELLNETHDLFKTIAAKAMIGNDALIGQTFDRIDTIMDVANTQRDTFKAKLEPTSPTPSRGSGPNTPNRN